jgi:CRISPR-associated protein Cst2
MEGDGESREQALATREFSQDDEMLMNFFIDIGAIGFRKRFGYEKEWHVRTEYVRHITEEERKRRVRLALEATSAITDYANQARNATTAEPQQVLIVFDTRLSRKASRYYKAEEAERKNILAELKARGANYFIGDDTSADGDSVAEAYRKSLEFLAGNDLFNPAPDATMQTTAEFEGTGAKPSKSGKQSA